MEFAASDRSTHRQSANRQRQHQQKKLSACVRSSHKPTNQQNFNKNHIEMNCIGPVDTPKKSNKSNQSVNRPTNGPIDRSIDQYDGIKEKKKEKTPTQPPTPTKMTPPKPMEIVPAGSLFARRDRCILTNQPCHMSPTAPDPSSYRGPTAPRPIKRRPDTSTPTQRSATRTSPVRSSCSFFRRASLLRFLST